MAQRHPSILKRKNKFTLELVVVGPRRMRVISAPLVPPRFSETLYRTSQRLPVLLWRRNESASELAVVARVELVGAIGSPPFQQTRFHPGHFDNIHSSNRSIGRALSVANNGSDKLVAFAPQGPHIQQTIINT